MISKLIQEYTDTTKHLRRYRESLDRSNPDGQDESKLVSGMISDMQFALEWMRRGRRPGNLRGAERSDIYRQRELLNTLPNAQIYDLSDFDRLRLVECLLTLSERERQCFLLHMAHGLTYAEISDKLKVSIWTVRSYIDRARRKVSDALTG